MVKQIFVNLPVKNLKKSVDFFTKLGFTFDAKFTNENGTCMILGENIFAMLLTESFFKGFIKKEIADAKKSTEVLLAVQLESREKVDEIMEKAIKFGGSEPRKPDDYGWMYQRSLEDLDGHIWELCHMDMSKAPAA